MVYNKKMKSKLVRDKIPLIIKKNGSIPITYRAGKKEFLNKIKEKLKEETEEFILSEEIEELADILEVIFTIAEIKHVNRHSLLRIQKQKKERNGGFSQRYILEEVK